MEDLVFTAMVKCPGCGVTWKERIAADVEEVQCLNCELWLRVKAEFTLVKKEEEK